MYFLLLNCKFRRNKILEKGILYPRASQRLSRAFDPRANHSCPYKQCTKLLTDTQMKVIFKRQALLLPIRHVPGSNLCPEAAFLCLFVSFSTSLSVRIYRKTHNRLFPRLSVFIG